MEETALVQTGAPDSLANQEWAQALELPCQLSVELPVPGFTVRSLLRLDGQSVVNTGWGESANLPIRINGQLIGWGEFEVVGERLAVRLNELG